MNAVDVPVLVDTCDIVPVGDGDDVGLEVGIYVSVGVAVGDSNVIDAGG
jgi:hypothetical protein